MTVLRVIDDRDMTDDLADGVRAMVVAAFGDEFSDDDWENSCGGWRIVALDGAEPVAHAAVVTRTIQVGGRPFRTGYVEAVATRVARQAQGLGTMVMRPANDLIRARFELGALSTNRHGFYERIGWERWRGPSYVRHGSTLARTEDEDDGVMVLRFGPSSALHLTAAIACEPRTGDDW
jgi:aminoglycoside 2'-N-acetyltransferase I